MIQTSVSQFHFQQPKVARVDLLACSESHLGSTDERLKHHLCKTMFFGKLCNLQTTKICCPIRDDYMLRVCC